MKTINKLFIPSLAVAALLTSCDGLETEYLGSSVTPDQKEETLEANPDMALAGVTAISTIGYAYDLTGGGRQCDFAIPALLINFDSAGNDYVCTNSGYNWFSTANGLLFGTDNNDFTNQVWTTMYDQIHTANSVLATIPPEDEENKLDDMLKFFRAQSLCFRAFDYWVLSQTYQQNYAYCDPETALCVPIITDENEEEAALNGAPRATVQAVYDQILNDLNEAIELLDGSSVTAESVMPDRPKRFFNLDAAYGMLARVCLTMHDYEGAMEAALNCLGETNCTPYTISQVSKPTFISLNDASWLWGQPTNENDDVVQTGLCNYAGMTGTFSYGYTQVGIFKWINKALYDYIPSTDVRKGWWLDDKFSSPNLDKSYINYLADFGTNTSDPNMTGLQIYSEVKYAPYNYQINGGVNASDIPYMRIEEIYYILAEAMAMTGNTSGAVSTLENFVKQYRDPAYSCSASSPQDIQDEIWMQRRIEFWGEGLVAWFDLKRLGKPLDRRGGHFPTAWVFNEPAGSEVFVLPIPLAEINYNPAITTNNPIWSTPSPVQDI